MPIDLTFLADLQPVGIYGLGRTGQSVANALMDAQIDFIVWDDDADNRQLAKKNDWPLADLNQHIEQINGLIVSSGLPLDHGIIQQAKDQQLPVFGDMALMARGIDDDQTVIGITGTNGKSTTTALIGHILNTADKDVAIGGNLTPPALSLEGDAEFYVLEMSSYQLARLDRPLCDIAVLLNLSPDHLSWHGGMDEYTDAKRHIFNTDTHQTAIIGVDTDRTTDIANNLSQSPAHNVIPVSITGRVDNGIWVNADGVLHDEQGDQQINLMDAIALPGRHNWQNIAHGYAVAKALDIPVEIIKQAIHDFPGLIHRQQLIGDIDGIRLVNDSKATNANATKHALRAHENIFWILGGLAKKDGLTGLEPDIGNVKKAYLIGDAADEFGLWLSGQNIDYEECDILDRAVEKAFIDAKESGQRPATVLLSPACASFDQYDSFEERGEHFIRLINDLKNHKSAIMEVGG